MKTTADVALVAQAIANDHPLVGFPIAWTAADSAVRALDEAGRLTPTSSGQCEDCQRTYTGPGRICPSCRAAEDGLQREPMSNEDFAALCATGYADDEAEF